MAQVSKTPQYWAIRGTALQTVMKKGRLPCSLTCPDSATHCKRTQTLPSRDRKGAVFGLFINVLQAVTAGTYLAHSARLQGQFLEAVE